MGTEGKIKYNNNANQFGLVYQNHLLMFCLSKCNEVEFLYMQVSSIKMVILKIV